MMRQCASGLFLICFVAGCGSSEVVVTGTLLKGGSPVSSDPNDQVMITFIEKSPKDPQRPRRYPTRVDVAGEFELKGPDGNGIPAGKYVVAASSMPMVPVKGQSPGDRFHGAFADDKTPWTAEVTPSQHVFTFDVDKR